jgi:hypothetical protein
MFVRGSVSASKPSAEHPTSCIVVVGGLVVGVVVVAGAEVVGGSAAVVVVESASSPVHAVAASARTAITMIER